MRIVFFGTPDIAVPTLKAVAAQHEVTAVVCQPDKPRGRSKKLVAPPAKAFAEQQGIAVHQPTKLNDGTFEAWLKEQQPDACVVAAYGRLLKQPLLDIPPHGHINMHPSLLPRWRGPSPIQSALVAGDQVTGVTIMKLSLEMDAGDMMLQRTTPIDPMENAQALSDRLSLLGAEMTVEVLQQLEAGADACTPQDDSEAVYCSMLRKEDGYIDWSKSAQEIHDRVRGTTPWPGAQCDFRGDRCKIHASAPLDEFTDAEPGTIVRVTNDALHVATGAGVLEISVFQLPGKAAMPVEALLRGRTIEPGEQLTTPEPPHAR